MTLYMFSRRDKSYVDVNRLLNERAGWIRLVSFSALLYELELTKMEKTIIYYRDQPPLSNRNPPNSWKSFLSQSCTYVIMP